MAKDEGSGGLRVVASNSERELVERDAQRRLTWPLKELTANLLRITRGAGKPYMLVEQLNNVAQVFQDYRDSVGAWPSEYDIHIALDRHAHRSDAADHDDLRWGIDTTAAGALQLVASELLQQRPQEAAGRREMIEGLKLIESARAKNWTAAQDQTPIVPFSQRNKPERKKPSPTKPKG